MIDLSHEATRVLVLDDSPVTCRLVTLALEKLGIRGQSCGPFDGALEALAKERWALVVVGPTGLFAAPELKAKFEQPALWVSLGSEAAGPFEVGLPLPLDLATLEAVVDLPPPKHFEPLAALDVRVLDELDESLGKDTTAQLIALYQRDAPKLLAELDAALKAKDAAVVMRSLHTLKSTSATLGAKKFADRCRDLEAQAREKGLHEVEAALDELVRAVEAQGESLRAR